MLWYVITSFGLKARRAWHPSTNRADSSQFVTANQRLRLRLASSAEALHFGLVDHLESIEPDGEGQQQSIRFFKQRSANNAISLFVQFWRISTTI